MSPHETDPRSASSSSTPALDPATSPLHGSRRSFLRKAGTLAAAALTSGATLATGVSAPKKGSAASAALYQLRRAAAKAVRFAAALAQHRTADPGNRANDDETTLAGYIASYTKGLPHNAYGEVDSTAYKKLLTALEGRSASAWEAIPLGGVRKLANPQASLTYSLVGGDSHSFFMRPAPAFNSAEEASEMAEVYLHALARDVPFEEYATDTTTIFAATELNAFSDFRGPRAGGLVTPGTLFRGDFPGDLTGNYISQFLLLPVPQGSATFTQRYQTTDPGDDHILNQADWLNSLRGGAPTTSNSYDPVPRYIANARDLGEFVHRDYSYQAFLQAALILLGRGAPLNPKNPYNTSATQGGFVTFGGPDILTQVAEAALLGLKAAWYQKWQVHRRLRPEVFAGRVHFTRTAARTYPINAELLNSPVLDAINMTFGGYWLPMAFPEGSPTHPAYPAGHAAIAGACVTVLKAFFKGSGIITAPVEVDPVSNGTALRPYSGAGTLTVEGELNKLASNIAIGRDLAGVHWRTDGIEGILLGEAVAVSMLRDERLTYTESYSGCQFTGFRGNTITI